MYNKTYNEALRLKEDAEFKLGLSKLDNSKSMMNIIMSI